jgi:hypothetical protein
MIFEITGDCQLPSVQCRIPETVKALVGFDL